MKSASWLPFYELVTCDQMQSYFVLLKMIQFTMYLVLIHRANIEPTHKFLKRKPHKQKCQPNQTLLLLLPFRLKLSKFYLCILLTLDLSLPPPSRYKNIKTPLQLEDLIISFL